MTIFRAVSRRRKAVSGILGWGAAGLLLLICSQNTAWAQPAWAITKTHTGNFSRGGTGAYTITVRNSGTTATTAGNTTVLSDSAPTGMTVTAMSGTGWSCSTTTCNRADSLAAAASYPAITVTVSVATGAPASLVNSATVSGGGVSTPATATDPTTIGAPALSIAKTHTGNFVAGGQGTYTLTISNTGNGPTLSPQIVQIFDNPPSGMTVTAISGTGWLCATGSLTGCNRGDALAPGASYPPVTVTVSVAAGATSPLVNVATAQGGGTTGTVTASDPTVIQPPPSLALIKTHTGSFTAGGQGTYSLTVRNTGAGPTLSSAVVQVFDTPPVGMTVTSISGTGWLCQTTPTAGCNRGDALAPGASFPPLTVIVSIAADAKSPLVNQASVSGGGAAVGASDTDSTVILSPASLAITKTHTGNFVAGQQGVYTVTVSNSGGAPTGTQLVQMLDTPPAGMAIVSISGTGWNCSTSTSLTGCTRNDALAAGASFPPISVTVNVAANAPPTLANVATVNGGGTTGTATASDPTVIVPSSSWSVQKTHTGNFVQGQQGSYTVTVTNTAAAAAAPGTFTLTDTPPTGMTLRSMAGTGWTCSVGNGSCTRSDGLAAGLSFPPVTITVDLAANAPSTLTNSVTLSDALSPNLATATDPTTIAPAATGLTLTKRHFGNFVVGQPGLYTLTVANNGAAAIAASSLVTVQDTPPAGMTVAGMAGTGWTCTGSACTRSDSLAVGQTYPAISVTVNLLSQSSSSVSLSNTATVTIGGTSLSASATDPTNVETGAVRVVSAGGSGQSAAVGTLYFSPIQVSVATPSGSPLAGAPVTFSTPASGPGGTWPNAQRTVTVSTNSGGVATAPALRANNLTGSFTVTASVGSQAGAPSTSFQMANTGALPPALIAPPILTFDLATGNSPPQTKMMTVDNGAGGPTPFTYRVVYPNPEAGGWITAVPTTLITPAVFKVTVSPGGAGPGRYLAFIVVTPLTAASRPAMAAELNKAAARLSGPLPAAGSLKDAYTAVVESIGLAPGGAGPFSFAPRCSWVSSDIGKPNPQSDFETQLPCAYLTPTPPTSTTIAPVITQGNPTAFTASLTFTGASTDWLTARLGGADLPVASGAQSGARGNGTAPITATVRPAAVQQDSETAFISAVLGEKLGGDVAVITTAVGKTLSAAPHTVTFDPSGPLAPATVTIGAIGGAVPFRAVPSAPWLTVDPPSGTVSPGASTTLTLTAAPTADLARTQLPATVTLQRTDDAAKDPEVVSVTLNNAAADAPQITSVVSGGSFVVPSPIAPASWVTIKGSGLANAQTTWDSSINNGRLPTTLGGVSVTINDIPAYVQFVRADQINVVAPADRTDGDVLVKVTNNGAVSAPVSVRLQPLAPAFLSFDKYAVTQRVLPEFAPFIGNPALNSGFVPAKPGDVLSLWVTGLGPTQPQVPDGQEPGAVYVGRPIVNAATVFLGGIEVPKDPILLPPAISQFPATYQIAIRVPNTVPDGDVPITVKVGDSTSPAGFYLYVKR